MLQSCLGTFLEGELGFHSQCSTGRKQQVLHSYAVLGTKDLFSLKQERYTQIFKSTVPFSQKLQKTEQKGLDTCPSTPRNKFSCKKYMSESTV